MIIDPRVHGALRDLIAAGIPTGSHGERELKLAEMERMLVLVRRTGDPFLCATAEVIRGQHLANCGRYGDAISSLTPIVDYCRHQGEHRLHAHGLQIMASCYHAQKDDVSALILCRRSIEAWDPEYYDPVCGEAMTILAEILVDRGQIEDAADIVENMQERLDRSRSIHGDPDDLFHGEMRVHGVLAVIKDRLREYDGSLVHAMQAYDAAAHSGNLCLQVRYSSRVGEAYLNKHDPMSASQWFRNALRLIEVYDDHALEVQCLIGIAQGYRDLKVYGIAEQAIERARSLSALLEGAPGHLDILWIRASIAARAHRPDAAVLLAEALHASETCGPQTRTLEILKETAEYYKRIGDPHTAIVFADHFSEVYVRVTDSLCGGVPRHGVLSDARTEELHYALAHRHHDMARSFGQLSAQAKLMDQLRGDLQEVMQALM